MNRILLAVLAITLCAIARVSADENVRGAQTRLKEQGFFFGEPSGVIDKDTSAAISRYQIRNGLQITGQLDAETAKSLGVAGAAARTNTAAAETGSWQQLRKSDRQFLERLETTKPGRKPGQVASAPAATAPPKRVPGDPPQPSPPRADPAATRLTVPTAEASGTEYGPVVVLSRERLRDYVAAFILAGLDPRVGAELEFFGDRVDYYNQGTVRRATIRADLQKYAQRWPERRFWLAGEVTVQPQSDSRLRVTFPLRYDLRNGSKRSSGRVQKTLLVEVVGDDLQIVGVSERKAG